MEVADARPVPRHEPTKPRAKRTTPTTLGSLFKAAVTSGAWHSDTVNGAWLRVRVIEQTSGRIKREVEAYDKARHNYRPITQKDAKALFSGNA